MPGKSIERFDLEAASQTLLSVLRRTVKTFLEMLPQDILVQPIAEKPKPRRHLKNLNCTRTLQPWITARATGRSKNCGHHHNTQIMSYEPVRETAQVKVFELLRSPIDGNYRSLNKKKVFIQGNTTPVDSNSFIKIAFTSWKGHQFLIKHLKDIRPRHQRTRGIPTTLATLGYRLSFATRSYTREP